MTSNPAEREAGTGAWRIDQARQALGFPTVKAFAEYLGVRVGTINNYQRDFDRGGKRRWRNAVALFRQRLPEEMADYIEHGGDDFPPEVEREWKRRVLVREREQREFSAAFEEAATVANGEPVSPFQQAYQAFRKDGMPWPVALTAAITALESLGQQDVAERYRPVFLSFLRKDAQALLDALDRTTDNNSQNGGGRHAPV